MNEFNSESLPFISIPKDDLIIWLKNQIDGLENIIREGERDDFSARGQGADSRGSPCSRPGIRDEDQRAVDDVAAIEYSQ